MIPLQIKFIRFLKDNNAYYGFKQNVMKNHMEKHNSIITYITIYIKFPKNIIQCGFSWSKSTEGTDFWNKLNNKWLEYYETNSTKTIY